MPQKTGKLVRSGKNFMVELPTKNGTANFPIPAAAKRFDDTKATDGAEVHVELDGANRILKVSIPNEPEFVPPAMQDKRPAHSGRSQPSGQRNPRSTNPGRDNQNPARAVRLGAKAPPSLLGSEFHHAYTFVEFESQPVRGRNAATLLTADETAADGGLERLTGILELKIETHSPLLTSQAKPVSDEKALHKVYRALAIGNDVIVPATGIRGSLRTLMTILTNGTLGYVDKTAYLIQGRDAKLGPIGKTQKPFSAPENVFLGEVTLPGTDRRDGRIRLGETKLVRLPDLESKLGRNGLNRAPHAKAVWIGLDSHDRPMRISDNESPETPWRLRLSGRPVGGRRIEERKKEALFKPSGPEITVPASLWAAYCGRHMFGERPALRRGDLVWLQPMQSEKNGPFHYVATAADIESLQWARWGKTGHALREKIPGGLLPDSWKRDRLVDEVTNLFGQVSDTESADQAISFAARVRPENLVFEDALSFCQQTVLAPLAPPHPGCLAFYRNNNNPDNVSFNDPLRGYKVYRTTEESGAAGPWNYSVQGVYKDGKLIENPQQNVNKTVDLLPPGKIGRLNITFHALTRRELALLVQACSVTWRLGGGKPFGLGRCRVTITGIIDEFGQRRTVEAFLGKDWQTEVADIQHRVTLWEASQKPVQKLRYPRAVHGNSRGGHAWFYYFGRPRMVSAKDDNTREAGLSPVYISGALQQKALENGHPLDPSDPMISGQILPPLSIKDPEADLLFGYDVIGRASGGARNLYDAFEPFDP